MFSITSLSMNSMQNAACSQLCLQPHPRASEPEHLSTTAGTPTPPSTPTSVCPPLPGRCPGHPGSQRGLDVDYCFDWVLTHLENCIFGSRGRMLWLTALPPRSPLLTSLRPWRFCLQPQQSRIPPPAMDMEILPWEVPDPGLQGPPRHWSQKGVLLAYPSSKVYVTKTNEITMWSRTSTEAAVQALSSPLCHYNIILLYQESTIFYCQHWGCCSDSGCCLSSGCCIDSSCSSDSGCCSSSGSCSDSKGCEKVQVCLGSVLMWLYRSWFDMYLICIRMAFFKNYWG